MASLMAKRDKQSGSVAPAKRTRTGAAWLSITLFVAFVILLIVFIAENNRRVPLHFLGGSWTVSESVALVAAAVGGALLVVLVGTARILQLRIAARRARRDLKRQNKAAASAPPASVPATSGLSTEGEAQPVEAEHQP
jgi:uncharacterized integral membrane protein